MDKSLLVKLAGFPATLIHGDTLVLDRWKWLKARLPVTKNREKLIDIGCGTGAFSIGAALRGYESLGLSWDERNQKIASERANICKALSVKFEILDIRNLDTREDLTCKFDVAICFETIEHIINDRKLLRDISSCLKPGGRLLLTTPNYHYRPISSEDNASLSKCEDGGHVRKGYTHAMLEELCSHVGLVPDKISYVSGLLSQKVTSIQRLFCRIHVLIGWSVTLPLRIIPPLFDKPVTTLTQWPYYSICLEAHKPRYSEND
jgi:SAM-dependent methyltransferase